MITISKANNDVSIITKKIENLCRFNSAKTDFKSGFYITMNKTNITYYEPYKCFITIRKQTLVCLFLIMTHYTSLIQITSLQLVS